MIANYVFFNTWDQSQLEAHLSHSYTDGGQSKFRLWEKKKNSHWVLFWTLTHENMTCDKSSKFWFLVPETVKVTLCWLTLQKGMFCAF